jgi:hypothetical protein
MDLVVHISIWTRQKVATRRERVLRSRGSLSSRRLAILLCIGIAARWCGLSGRRLAILICIRIVLFHRLARGYHDEGGV